MWYLLTNLYKSLHKKYLFQTCLILPVVKFGSNEYFLKLWLNMLMGRMENNFVTFGSFVCRLLNLSVVHLRLLSLNLYFVFKHQF
ncbi:hypothetical protein P8452_55187 [Trifolium repens]|nr:hypothetical protein P8452_55187 [Trifolium repens]